MSHWGLIYASTFTGSMLGAGAPIFAVWAYAIAHGFGGRVDLHPKLVAAQIGITDDEAARAIAYLASPDPESRTKSDSGRRLKHVSGVVYEIVNYERYNQRSASITEYNRLKQQECRQNKRLASALSNHPVNPTKRNDTKRDDTKREKETLFEGKETPAAPSPKPKARKTPLPDKFQPSESVLKLAAKLRVDLHAEWPAFCDYARKNASTYADWDAAARTWVRNARKFADRKGPR